MFITKKLHNKIVKSKENEITELKGKLENRDKLLKKDIEIYEDNKIIKTENEELRSLIAEFESLANTQQYGSVENLQNKIKSILMTAKSI